MVIWADRNFTVTALPHQINDTGAHYLVWAKNARHLPMHQVLEGGSYLPALTGKRIWVITARITLHTTGGQKPTLTGCSRQ